MISRLPPKDHCDPGHSGWAAHAKIWPCPRVSRRLVADGSDTIEKRDDRCTCRRRVPPVGRQVLGPAVEIRRDEALSEQHHGRDRAAISRSTRRSWPRTIRSAGDGLEEPGGHPVERRRRGNPGDADRTLQALSQTPEASALRIPGHYSDSRRSAMPSLSRTSRRSSARRSHSLTTDRQTFLRSSGAIV